MKRAFLATIGLIFFLLQSSFAMDEGGVSFKNISINQGLSQSTVYTIAQDHLGFMWFGTQDGLNRYDGYAFQVYRPKRGDSSAIESSYIRSLFIDTHHQLWVGGNNGVSRFERDKNTFRNYTLKPISGEWFISAIASDDTGDLWLGTSRGELYKYDRDGDKFTLVNLKISDRNISSINAICSYEGELLLGTNNGVFKLNTRSLNATELPSSRGMNVNVILKDTFLWVGTEGKGLFRFDRDREAWMNYSKETVSHRGSIASDNVRSLQMDNNGNLWIGTFNGLSILNLANDSIENYYHESFNSSTLSQNSVRSIYKDRQGGLWLGTFYGGISYFNKYDINFRLINRNTGEISLDDDVVNVIKEDSAGGIWIGTNDNGLELWDRKQNKIKHFSGNVNGSPSFSNNIKAIEFTDKGEVLIGTHNSGLILFNPATNRTVYFTPGDAASSLIGNMVYALLKDRKGRLWIGTRSGLDLFHEDTREFEHFQTDRSGTRLSSNQITSMLEDHNGLIWIGTTNGINIFDPEKKTFKVYPGEMLSNDVVTSIAEDRKGEIWIGTKGGLNKYLPHSNSFKQITNPSLDIDGIIYSIQNDKQDAIWFTTSRDLIRYEPEDHVFKAYNNGNIGQFNLSASCMTSDKMLLFGGTNGLVYFYPGKIYTHNPDLDLSFTGFRISNISVYVDPKKGPLYEDLNKQKKIRLKYVDNTFAFSFNAFDYIAPNEINYRYRLEGYDKDWNEVKGIPLASYSNLDPGRYHFIAQVLNTQDKILAKRSVELVISPPWWKSVWFILSAGLLVIGLTIFIYNILRDRIRSIQDLKLANLQNELVNNKWKMERLEREKTVSLNKMKTEFFTNISHELKTPLTLIMGPIEDLLKEEKSRQTARKYYKLMLGNAKRLYRLVDQILEFRKTETGVRKLSVAQGNLQGFMKEVFHSFNSLARKKNIRYKWTMEGEAKPCFFDQDVVERIGFNLLSNAFKYTPERGHVKVRLSQTNEKVEISFEDSGPGIREEEQKDIFKRFYRAPSQKKGEGYGIGLAFAQKLVELHHGTIHLRSKIGEGSVFSVVLPIQKQAYSEEELQENVLLEKNDTLKAEAHPDYSFLGDPEFEVEEESPESSGDILEGKKILLVDDNQEILDFLKEYFKNKVEIQTAPDGAEGLKALEDTSFEMIISDVMMPHVDGIQFCKKVKQNINTSHIPFILLTAKSEISHQIEGLQAGADDYLTKPFSAALLETKMKSILKYRETLKEFYSSSEEFKPEELTYNDLDKEFMAQVIEIIEHDLEEVDFSIDKLSQKIGMSRSNLYLKVKAITGESVVELIKKIRFQEAIKLLKTGRYNISEITYKCGFSSPSYFSTSFKKHFGYKPSEYSSNAG